MPILAFPIIICQLNNRLWFNVWLHIMQRLVTLWPIDQWLLESEYSMLHQPTLVDWFLNLKQHLTHLFGCRPSSADHHSTQKPIGYLWSRGHVYLCCNRQSYSSNRMAQKWSSFVYSKILSHRISQWLSFTNRAR